MAGSTPSEGNAQHRRRVPDDFRLYLRLFPELGAVRIVVFPEAILMKGVSA
ncbi:hypothetical protein [Oceanomicrobium pacificus]|uniref:Uncharacterized protein n=1 Tax=Oceanomicrobium pacificus TaxID=2692916 RepID=A0A6B0U419_9RHOB|nr:hypothetical protein [Oceanomicrobium pacificus]MXU65691.1 hypothetical protein [Oceanomicrobium pacificus]